MALQVEFNVGGYFRQRLQLFFSLSEDKLTSSHGWEDLLNARTKSASALVREAGDPSSGPRCTPIPDEIPSELMELPQVEISKLSPIPKEFVT
jgi:hypothetical protein